MQTWEKLRNNPELFKRYFVKEYILTSVRKFFEKKKYHEFDCPILTNSLPQERYLDILETKLEQKNGSTKTAYLIPSTETFNKKILVAGLGNHFVISKVFRGLEEISKNHSPEFTMLEWYTLDKDYFFLMKQTEMLIKSIVKTVFKKVGRKYSGTINYQGTDLILNSRWYRYSVPELLKKYLNTNIKKIQDVRAFYNVLSKFINIEETDDWQALFELFMANLVEPNLKWDRPVFIYDFPKILCPLTKVSDKNPFVAEKVELYIFGKEIANGYTELTNWQIQKENFLLEQQSRKESGKKEIAFDDELISALKSGMPEVAGIGLGIDRLAMILADADSISDINYFPAEELFS